MAKTFRYFGYGSNLLRERILVKNKTSVFTTIARLDDYRLCFGRPESAWRGATASISTSPGDHVWGCVWEIGVQDLPNLDSQEGVDNGIYRPISVTVQTPGDDQIECKSYQLVHIGSDDTRPSPQYLSVIQRGAAQNSLPQEYQDKLSSIEHNGYTGRLKLMDDVEKLIEQFKLKEQN